MKGALTLFPAVAPAGSRSDEAGYDPDPQANAGTGRVVERDIRDEPSGAGFSRARTERRTSPAVSDTLEPQIEHSYPVRE
jgi:hypothetical protein